MTVAVVVLSDRKATQMVQWAAHFARARGADLRILHPLHKANGTPKSVEVSLEPPAAEDDVVPLIGAVREVVAEIRAAGDLEISFREVRHLDPVRGILQELGGCQLLILPRHTSGGEPDELERQLFRRAACQTMVLRPGASPGTSCRRLLVPVAGGPHSRGALRLAADLVERNDGRVTALFVEPQVGADAELVGRRIIHGLVSGALGSRAERAELRIVLANNIFKGLASVDLEPYDLVFVGASNQGAIRRMLFGTVPESVMARETAPAVAVIRAPVPLASRLRQGVERLLQRTVPQLARDDRLALVERVQSNSQWDFDFVALMCLATSIAAFGLVRDAGAVVIGAMLVAPLMTPLLGSGLALVQGNAILVRNALRAVVSGFLLAFAIGYFIGEFTGLDGVTLEMQARGSPNLVDLAVAFVSGVAAAYATCRPGLSAALPGVAIAAALVPPIATSGLAVALDDLGLALGALLLFTTNIIAIVIATAFTLWAVGIRSSHEHGRIDGRTGAWTRWMRALLVMLVLGVSIKLAIPAGRLPSDLAAELQAGIESHPGATLRNSRLTGSTGEQRVRVEIETPTPLPDDIAVRLAGIASRHYGESAQVVVVTHLVGTAELAPAERPPPAEPR